MPKKLDRVRDAAIDHGPQYDTEGFRRLLPGADFLDNAGTWDNSPINEDLLLSILKLFDHEHCGELADNGGITLAPAVQEMLKGGDLPDGYPLPVYVGGRPREILHERYAQALYAGGVLPVPLVQAWLQENGNPTPDLNYPLEVFQHKAFMLYAVARAWEAVRWDDKERLEKIVPALVRAHHMAYPTLEIPLKTRSGGRVEQPAQEVRERIELQLRRKHIPSLADVRAIDGDGIPPRMSICVAAAYCDVLNAMLEQLTYRLFPLADSGNASMRFFARDLFDQLAYYLSCMISNKKGVKALRRCASCRREFLSEHGKEYCGAKGCNRRAAYNRRKRAEDKEAETDGKAE